MSDHESERQIERQVDANEISHYQAVFEAFYSDQKAVLEAIGMVYFDPHQEAWKKELNDAVKQIQDSFRKCIREIMNTSKDANEFSLDITEFMIENERTRIKNGLTLMPTDEPKYQTYNKIELHDSIHQIHQNITDTRIMIEKITTLFLNGLHGDLHVMLADIVRLQSRSGEDEVR